MGSKREARRRGPSRPGQPSEPKPRPRAIFTDHFLDDLRFWVQNRPSTALRLLELIEAVLREPTQGIGKPERLRHWVGNVWSRRITEEHRLVYEIEGAEVRFLQARYHYD